MDSLIRNIAEFIEVLRLSGIRLSISETMDAILSLDYIDILNKTQVKYAMSSCLAKSNEEKIIFGEAFDTFFISSELRQEKVCSKVKEMQEINKDITQKASELKFQDSQFDLGYDLKEVYANLPAEKSEAILDFLKKTSEGTNVSAKLKPAIENILKGQLKNLKQKMLSEGCKLKGTPFQIPSDAGIIAEEIMENSDENQGLFSKNIGEISENDIPKVVNLIRLLADKLRKNLSRKYKKSCKKSTIDLKKTIRANLSTGIVQFKLKYKSKSQKKDNFLVLCDVSASMYRFSGFALQFIYGMHTNASSTKSYIFSEEMEHLNMNNFVSASNFEEKLQKSHVWRKGTNIRNVLESLLNSKNTLLNSSTVMVIVSDAKTLYAEESAAVLKLINPKVKRIIWLNPIPKKDWGSISCLEKFSEHSIMLDCSTIERLGYACRML